MKPGVTAADVARAENDVFRKHGLGDYVTNKYTRVRGHGLGLMCDLKPNILEEIDVELKPGMTIIVHPNTYHPETGYMVLGDVVVVTETGHERLTRTPAQLFEMPVYEYFPSFRDGPEGRAWNPIADRGYGFGPRRCAARPE